MSASDGILLALSVIVFVYLGVALFKAERETHYLKVYAYRIRRKLHDEGGEFLQSDPSVGYRLVPPPADNPRS